jgi:hypothetical protein
MQTQPVVPAETATRYRAAMAGSMTSTDAVRSRQLNHFLIPRRTGGTDAISHDEATRSLKIVANENPVVAEGKSLKKSVDGVVGKYDEVSVTCDLRLGEKTVHIQLPRALFPDELRYGLPVSVQMMDDGGVRRPAVSIREVDPQATTAVAAEFDALIEKL